MLKVKSYEDLFDKYIRTKKIFESVVLIKNGTGETIKGVRGKNYR